MFGFHWHGYVLELKTKWKLWLIDTRCTHEWEPIFAFIRIKRATQIIVRLHIYQNSIHEFTIHISSGERVQKRQLLHCMQTYSVVTMKSILVGNRFVFIKLFIVLILSNFVHTIICVSTTQLFISCLISINWNYLSWNAKLQSLSHIRLLLVFHMQNAFSFESPKWHTLTTKKTDSWSQPLTMKLDRNLR